MSLIFAPEIPVQLMSHVGMDEKKKPSYIFRSATIAETKQEESINATICQEGDPDQVVSMCTKSINNRLLRVDQNGKAKEEFLNFEETLTEGQVVELFTMMRMSSRIGHELKKKFKSLSSTGTEESAKDAAPKTAESSTPSQ